MKISGRTQPLKEYPIETCLKRLRSTGFESVELCLENLDMHPSVLTADKAARTGSLISMLGFAPYAVSFHRDYIHGDEDFEWTKKALSFMPDFGSGIFIVSGARGGGGGGKEWELLLRRTGELVHAAEESGTSLAIEFEPGFVVGSSARLLELFEDIPSANLAANLDLGHVFLCDPDPVEAILSLGNRIVHCHVEDMAEGVHSHLTPGDGDMDLGKYFRALDAVGFDGNLALDLYDCDYEREARRSIPNLKAILSCPQ